MPARPAAAQPTTTKTRNSKPRTSTAGTPPKRTRDDKDLPLREDIRLLGRVLGEVIREQEGREAYELVEQIRKLSVAFRLKRDAQAGKSFDKLLKSL